ncbi:MAG: 2-hydroxychromene-2-carboxylate isomerase, partial [Proteobacteria bacterium]
SPRTRDARRWLAERARRLRGAPHRVLYFHQADDPYGQLAAQALGELVRRYDVELAPRLVGPPPDDAAPERARLEAFARRDAADVAPGYGLAFPAADAPDPDDVALANRILAAGLADADFPALAVRTGAALWRRDRGALEAMAANAAPQAAARAALDAGNRERARRGHYLGAMLHYGGEWYWGVDRLHHLERRLAVLGARRPGAPADPIAPRPDPSREPARAGAGRGIVLEFYASLRSPYSYVAMERSYALAARYGVELALRPVLPMVMRGLPVPAAKRLYITLDTKREADDAGVPFGRVCDPVGRPVERAFSLWPHARAAGAGPAYLLSFARAAFAEGVDTGTDAGLRCVAERAGLDWERARADLDREGWRDELERNRAQLLALGLWGVPSYRVQGGGRPDYATWGQDRLWRVEQEIRARL